MKKRSKANGFGIIIALTVSMHLALPHLLRADDAISVKQNPFLGIDAATKSFLSQSDCVLVGKIVKLEIPNKKEPGILVYRGIKISVAQNLKGRYSGGTFTLRVYNGHSRKEPLPRVGDFDIILAKGNEEKTKDQYEVLKMLPATAESISKIKILIRDLAAGG